MLSKLRIGPRLFLLLGLLLAIMATVGLIGLHGTRAVDQSLVTVYEDRVIPMILMDRIDDAYRDGIIGAAENVSGGTMTAAQATASIEEADRTIEDAWAKQLASHLAERARALEGKAEPQRAQAKAATDRLRTILGAGDMSRLRAWLDTERSSYQPILASMRELSALQVDAAKQEYDRANAIAKQTRQRVLAGMLIGTLLAAVLGYWLIREIVNALGLLIGDVQRAGIQINTSAAEISATARQQQTTATEVAATTLEVGATARQISSTSKELVRTIDDLLGTAEAMTGLAGNGQHGLSQMETSMHQITEATGGINTRFAVLNDRAANINTVVTTIAKVADRTNLLSLNAAIEAEKAGEYGRGFAVVATEIRRLADQTADATSDIEQMVREIQSAITAGVMGTDKFSEEVRRAVAAVADVSQQLSEIIHQVQGITPRVEAVNEGMQSQSEGAQQISEALTQLGEASQQTVESLVQSTEAIEQLNDAARRLQSGVARIKQSV